MSTTTGPTEAQLALASYDRMLAETRKFSAEQNKLASEAAKLQAEEKKLGRDRFLAPWQATAIALGAIAALVASLVSIAKSFGWMP